MMRCVTQRRLFAHSLVWSTLRWVSSGFLMESGGLGRLAKRGIVSGIHHHLHHSRHAPASLSSWDGTTTAAMLQVRGMKNDHSKRGRDTSCFSTRCFSCTASDDHQADSSPLLEERLPLLDTDKETWLIVGDGDLSYSAWTAGNLPNDTQLFASVLEDESTHQKVYRNSENHSETIQSNGQQVLFEVDATELLNKFPASSLDRIIFNFPHWRGKANNRYNRLLLNNFLESAAQVIKDTGEIHVALIPGQGGSHARDMIAWRGSWMAAQYAADHDLMLSRIDDFTVAYDLSSHRGVDRPFSIGKTPRQYVFTKPNATVIPEVLQMACRHELRIRMHEADIAASCWTHQELVEGEVILQTIQNLVKDTGIRATVPLRDLITTSDDGIPLLVFLMVYAGETQPLTRAGADQIRSELEQLVQDMGFEVAKAGRMVSRPFPYPMLETLIEDRS